MLEYLKQIKQQQLLRVLNAKKEWIAYLTKYQMEISCQLLDNFYQFFNHIQNQ